MSGTPAWQAATASSTPLAAHINQLLGTHIIQNLYAGSLQASQTTAGSTSTASNGLYIAQKFTTGSSQTAVGYISIPLTTTTTSGASLAPTTVSLYSDSGGAPGSALVSATVSAEYANLASGGTATASLLYPLPASGLTPSTQYWIVVASAGTSGAHFTWYQSNQTSGASTSTTGTSWTAQTYGLLFQLWDQTAAGPLTCTWEDSGARWTATTYTSGTSLVASLAEYTTGQTSAGYVQSYRALTYTSGLLTGVA